MRASNRKSLLLAGVIFDVNIVRPRLVGAGVMRVGVAIALGREQRPAPGNHRRDTEIGGMKLALR
jgi:hypothetical protein